jgi:hypothetical protein
MSKIIKHKLVTGLFAAAFAFVLGGFGWAIAALGARNASVGSGAGGIMSAGRIILHFNDIGGITRLGGIGDLWYAGIFAVIAVAINYAIALELDARDGVMGKTMAAITLAAAILLFIACAAILSVN